VKETLPEPWLRGPIAGVGTSVMPVFFCFLQVREDLTKHTAGLTREQVWQRIGESSVGFHMKHLAGSVERLTTYVLGAQLSSAHLDYLRSEHDADLDLSELLELVDKKLSASEAQLLQLDPGTLFEARTVGRRALPTTVLGLLVHLAEHTQRHLGQAITLSQVVRHSV